MPARLAVAAVALALAAAGCAHSASAPAPAGREPAPIAAPVAAEPIGQSASDLAPLPVPPGATVERGKATYYADRFAGRRTASGERYDPNALTAAHRTLPFGAVVDVARDDGRHVQVRINDRGPFGRRDRVIDLSRRAARELGIGGLGAVALRVVQLPPETKQPARAKHTRRGRHTAREH